MKEKKRGTCKNNSVKDEIQVFCGNANRTLARSVCEHLGVALGQAVVRRFSDGETMVEIAENVRGSDVFVIQSSCTPVNDTLMELLLMLDALRRASAMRSPNGSQHSHLACFDNFTDAVLSRESAARDDSLARFVILHEVCIGRPVGLCPGACECVLMPCHV